MTFTSIPARGHSSRRVSEDLNRDKRCYADFNPKHMRHFADNYWGAKCFSWAYSSYNQSVSEIAQMLKNQNTLIEAILNKVDSVLSRMNKSLSCFAESGIGDDLWEMKVFANTMKLYLRLNGNLSLREIVPDVLAPHDEIPSEFLARPGRRLSSLDSFLGGEVGGAPISLDIPSESHAVAAVLMPAPGATQGPAMTLEMPSLGGT